MKTRISVDLPEWLLKAIDAESERIGVARQALIKMLLAKVFSESTDKSYIGADHGARGGSK